MDEKTPRALGMTTNTVNVEKWQPGQKAPRIGHAAAGQQ